MNNKEFIATLAKNTGIGKERAQTLVNAVIAAMSSTFDEGDNVTVANFGTFEPKKRTERIIVNPSSGQRMLVPPKIVLNFKPAANVKGNIKKGGAE
ncbi:MAG: HU family DNA-binding protein [Bacteroidales bacterium]|nr:HU family DNA-binding protein [Bacteroidales bacterium]MCM1147520.1 HU family DNA-binding protein [Bacteroidales bacterium]MCM1206189.1 HU family DNA-binding protein [Bacillota bacterium]MCM1509977.1 HU family DNA-binding protein [Clostridium sp.]